MMLTLSLSVPLQKQYPFSISQLPSSAYTTLCKWGLFILSLLLTALIFRFRQNAPPFPLIIAHCDYSHTDDDDEIYSTSEFEDDDDEEEEEDEEEEDDDEEEEGWEDWVSAD